MNIPFRVVCINDRDRPNEIPESKWIVKEEQYTVIEISRLTADQGKLGFKLAEIDLSACAPFLYFDARRFVPVSEIDHEPLHEEQATTQV